MNGELLGLLKMTSVLRAPEGKPFVLKSGATSMTYVDVRLTAFSARGLKLLSHELARRLHSFFGHGAHGHEEDRIDLVAGVVVGGCPLATGVSLQSGIDALYVRPEAKDHGSGRLIEGTFRPGQKVVLLEDVIASGGSTLAAIAALRAARLDVRGVVAVLDREQGGMGSVRQECPATALFTLKELLA